MDAQWQVQEAKQRFSELLRRVESDGAQFVTRHGRPVAVVMDMEEYRNLESGRSAGFKEHLLAAPKGADLDIERSTEAPREIDLSGAQ